MFSPSRVVLLFFIAVFSLAGASRVVGQVSAPANVQAHKQPIDPSLSYSTYLDATLSGFTGAAWDSTGNACILVGNSLIKLRNDGSLVYSKSNYANSTRYNSSAVAIDSEGSCYIAGIGPITPTAGVFQTSAASQQFIVKLDASGSIVYATYVGGSGTDTPAAALPHQEMRRRLYE